MTTEGSKPGRRAAVTSQSCPGVSECGRREQARGLCAACYQWRMRNGKLPRLLGRNRGTACTVSGCSAEAVAKGLCISCYRRSLRERGRGLA